MTILEVRHEFQGSLIEVQRGVIYVYRSDLITRRALGEVGVSVRC